MTTTRSSEHQGTPLHTVPTHLKTPDKILFGLTARQLLVLLTGGSLAYALWLQGNSLALSWGLASPWRLVLASLGVLPLAILTLSTTFVSLADRPLELWLIVWLRKRTAPQQYVWRASKWEPVEQELPLELETLDLSWMQDMDEEELQDEADPHMQHPLSWHLPPDEDEDQKIAAWMPPEEDGLMDEEDDPTWLLPDEKDDGIERPLVVRRHPWREDIRDSRSTHDWWPSSEQERHP